MDKDNLWIIALAVITIVGIIAVFGMTNMTGMAVKSTDETALVSAETHEVYRERELVFRMNPCGVRSLLKHQGVRLNEQSGLGLKAACVHYYNNGGEDLVIIRERTHTPTGTTERLLVMSEDAALREGLHRERYIVGPCGVQRILDSQGIRVPKRVYMALEQACAIYREQGGELIVKPISRVEESSITLVEMEHSSPRICWEKAPNCEAQCAYNFACCQYKQYEAIIQCAPIQNCLDRCDDSEIIR